MKKACVEWYNAAIRLTIHGSSYVKHTFYKAHFPMLYTLPSVQSLEKLFSFS